MAFSPDGTKLAIAQSDNIVFVYKLGSEWGDRKSICNKFPQSSATTCVCWPSSRPYECVFGVAEGKVKVGQMRSNKAATLYTHPQNSCVVSVAASLEGDAIVSGHADGSMYVFHFDGANSSVQMLAKHSCAPQALSWGRSICAAGNNGQVVLYAPSSGNPETFFDHGKASVARDFTCASFNSTGDCVVVGAFNCFHVYHFNHQRGVWEDAGQKTVENLYTVSSLSFKPDGSKLTVGSVSGCLDFFEACVKKVNYLGKFEFTYVSQSQVIVKRLQTGARIVLKSRFGHEIVKLNVKEDRYLLAYTPETLLLGDLESCRPSEIPWHGQGKERFIFDNPHFAMVYKAGELSIVEYGTNEVIGICRTEYISPYLLSVRYAPASVRFEENKKIAYLVDLQTVRIVDLNTSNTLATVHHDSKIDWLEMNEQGTHVLFRDKRRQLHLYELSKQKGCTLLSYCSYVQWVPGSNVVVAQNRDSLCVWYSINQPEQVMMFPIKGEVEDIERAGGRTEVIVNEGMDTVSYALDESLIAFGTAVERGELDQAADILDPLELTPDTEAMWMQLSQHAIEDRRLLIAERCYAALGYVTKARYLHSINEMVHAAAVETNSDGTNNFMVKAKLAALGQQWQTAENLLLEQGKIDDALNMHIEMHHWEQGILVAEKTQSPELESLRENYYHWLIESGQEDKAAQIQEEQGEYLQAVGFYLKAGLPYKAAQVIMNNHVRVDQSLLEDVSVTLERAGMLEQLGTLYEFQGRMLEAKDAYLHGHAFRKALELSRRESPHECTEIEERWGDWLVTQKQTDAAINHFIEAGKNMKAIHAACECRQWSKAVSILQSLDREAAMPYYVKIARHYEEARKHEEAERYYVAADMPKHAVNMYASAGKWDAAHRVATGYLTESEIKHFYTQKASELEGARKLRDAEKMFITVKEYDLAINMYKKKGLFDQMIRLVSIYRKDLLKETHQHLAHQLESGGSFKEAEKHFVKASDWKGAVQMYRAQNMWDEALRVARHHGGSNASKQVAYAWAVSLGGEEGAKLLNKFGLIEQAIDYAIESGAFMHAFELTRNSMKEKLPEVHLKYAMFLEDEGRFPEAEEEFIRAGKPKEAVDMYTHQQEWGAALRIANEYEPKAVPEVYEAQVRLLAEARDYPKAEALCVQSKMPETAIKMYKEAGMWEEALRVAETYAPSMVDEIRHGASAQSARPAQSVAQQMQKARGLAAAGKFGDAIDLCLAATSSSPADLHQVEGLWDFAVKLASEHLDYRVNDVIATVSERLIHLSRHEQAVDLLTSVGALKDAVTVCLDAGMVDKAQGLAAGDAALVEYVQRHAGRGREPGGGPGAAGAGPGSDAASVDLLVQQGDLAKAKALAEKQGADWTAYAMKLAKQRIHHGRYGDAARLLAHCDITEDAPLVEMLRHVALEVLGGRSDAAALQALADMLKACVRSMEVVHTRKALLGEFAHLSEAAHLMLLKVRCAEAGLKELAAKQATSLLRYVGVVPADKAFYEAGVATRDVDAFNMSFVFFNRYLDLIEAIDDPDAADQLDNADFADTDIPFDFELPSRHYLDERDREEVRDWVLTLSMDQQVDQALSVRTCANCGVDTYEAGLKCHSCHSRSESCVVTGYPIPPGEHVSPTGRAACRSDWNLYVGEFGRCPYTGAAQSPAY